MFAGIEVIRIPFVARERRSHAIGPQLPFICVVRQPFRSAIGVGGLSMFYEPSPVTVGLPGMVMPTVKKASLMFSVQDLWPKSLSVTGSGACH
jgi:colanic acid biosynthesis glycosyl transferase WcaI